MGTYLTEERKKELREELDREKKLRRQHVQSQVAKPRRCKPRKTKKDLFKAAKEKFDQEHPFKPKLVKTPKPKKYNSAERIKELSCPRTFPEPQPDLSECTFTPKVKTTRSYSTQPVELRLQDAAESYKDKLSKVNFTQKILQKTMQEFKALKSKSKPPLTAEKPIWDRAKDFESKKAQKLQQLLEEQTNYTFKPLVKSVNSQKTISGFLNKYLKATHNNYEDTQCTFHPKVKPATEKYFPKEEKAPYESQEYTFQPKTNSFAKPRIHPKKPLENPEDQNLTFKPQINQISKELSKSKTSQELSSRNSHIALLTAKYQKYTEEQCPFKPFINSTSVQSKLGQNPLKYFKQAQEKHHQHIQNLRTQEELKLKQNCTFTPQTTEPPEYQDVAIPGLTRFIEVKQIQAKLQADQKAREEKVFGIHYKGHKGYKTQPEPFNLHTPNTDRCQKTHSEVKSKEKQACTFRPETIESKNKAFISRLLSENFNQLKA